MFQIAVLFAKAQFRRQVLPDDITISSVTGTRRPISISFDHQSDWRIVDFPNRRTG